MLNFLPSIIVGTLTSLLLGLNTIFWCVQIYLFTLLKLIPVHPWRRLCTQAAIWLAEMWISCNSGWMWLMHKTKWDVVGLDGLSKDDWYLVISNHQSWADIFVLQHLFNRRIPFLKFFLKQALIWVPVIGLAWWGLDFPFMKRYSRNYLKKHPEKRGKDLETTRKACEKFKFTHVSVMNFLEGTRFTSAKHAKQESPHKHLLRPKAGGIAYVLAAMDEQIKTIVNVTIVYPDGNPTFGDFLSGRINRVVVRVNKFAIPRHFLQGDYQNDPFFREQFQAWVRELWDEKDELIESLVQKRPSPIPEKKARARG
ncbi:MAG: acyltransferase [Chloroflexi bacterium]|nr:acyltransferase [Chloroflexota bacterium]